MKQLNLDPQGQNIAARLVAVIRQWLHHTLSRVFESYDLFLDSLPASREQTAHHLLAMAQQLVREPDNLELLHRIEVAAKSRNRFKRCYALDTLGRLGERARESVPVQIEGLSSDDPFVREAAAQALFRLGKWAAPAKKELAHTLENHVNEGTARYAVLALAEIGDTSPEILDALRYAASAENSYAAEEAASLYHALSPIPRRI